MKGFWMAAILGMAISAGGCGMAAKTVKSSAPPPNGVDAQMQAFSGVGETSRTDQGFDIVIPGDSLFKPGYTHLSADGIQKAEDLAPVLSKFSADSVTVLDYTDNIGKASKNLRLSQRRADHLKAELVKLGIATAAITAQGKGESDPMAANDTSQGQAQNRRVVVEIVPRS